MSGSKRRATSRSRTPVLLLTGLGVVIAAAGIALMLMRADERTAESPRTVASDSSAPGRLVASQTTVDLGQVPFDKQVEARFELANTGGGTVRLVGAPRVRMLEGC